MAELDPKVPVITVDGPGGAGKGTVSQFLASDLGWHWLDSGALYRLTALSAEMSATSLDDELALGVLAECLDVSFEFVNGVQQVRLNGDDVSEAIRREGIGAAASRLAVLSTVRRALLERQRQFARSPGLVADGRDMGTVVFPHADIKFFITASSEEKAQRRYKQLKDKGLNVSLRELETQLKIRDERDQSREVSPLIAATDAIVLDTSGMTIDEVNQHVMELVKQAGL